jgi:hypothetical protein
MLAFPQIQDARTFEYGSDGVNPCLEVVAFVIPQAHVSLLAVFAFRITRWLLGGRLIGHCHIGRRRYRRRHHGEPFYEYTLDVIKGIVIVSGTSSVWLLAFI